MARVFPIKHFMMICNLTVPGLTTLRMAMFGFRMRMKALNLMPPAAIGLKHLMAIPGYPITHGDGRRSITGAGVMTIITDGNGYPAIPGDPHGLTGGTVADIMPGRRLGPVSVSTSRLVAVITYLMTIGFARRRLISVTGILATTMCRAPGW